MAKTVRFKTCADCGGKLARGKAQQSVSVAGHTFTTEIEGLVCAGCGESYLSGGELERFELSVASALTRAATILGEEFPISTLKSCAAPTGAYSLTYLKYDALIVACAARHKAEMIISLDEKPDFRNAAVAAKIPVRKPGSFRSSQQLLPLQERAQPEVLPLDYSEAGEPNPPDKSTSSK